MFLDRCVAVWLGLLFGRFSAQFSARAESFSAESLVSVDGCAGGECFRSPGRGLRSFCNFFFAVQDLHSVDKSLSESVSNASWRSRFGSPARWLLVIAVVGSAFAVRQFGFKAGSEDVTGAGLVIPAPYDADRAFSYLNRICDLGPRPSATAAMARQQELLTEFFRERGADVELQKFNVRHPETGQSVELANLIARWHPDRPKRFLLCAHYDTRPYPDRDPVNPKGRFVGANDGGSGVAALMELSHHVGSLPADVGVDMVFFDGEELVYREGRDNYFLGSEHFAREYVANPPPIGYQAGVLLDMVGDKELAIYYERNSWNYAREVSKSIFATAKSLGVEAFIPRVRHEIRDDHLPLNQIAKIPTVDLIDFDYPRPGIGAPRYWHTTQDVPENCSGHSLATVVYVVHQWLMRQ
jgi:glutaminyl-peptide cyclotransferase